MNEDHSMMSLSQIEVESGKFIKPLRQSPSKVHLRRVLEVPKEVSKVQLHQIGWVMSHKSNQNYIVLYKSKTPAEVTANWWL